MGAGIGLTYLVGTGSKSVCTERAMADAMSCWISSSSLITALSVAAFTSGIPTHAAAGALPPVMLTTLYE
jgi:hypothetical protein